MSAEGYETRDSVKIDSPTCQVTGRMVCVSHVLPPSSVCKMSVPRSPTAQHVSGLGQLMACSVRLRATKVSCATHTYTHTVKHGCRGLCAWWCWCRSWWWRGLLVAV